MVDVTFISTRGGWLYLAVLVDLYSRLGSKPPGSEFYNQHGANPLEVSGNLLNQTPFSVKPSTGDFRLQAKNPAIARSDDFAPFRPLVSQHSRGLNGGGNLGAI